MTDPQDTTRDELLTADVIGRLFGRTPDEDPEIEPGLHVPREGHSPTAPPADDARVFARSLFSTDPNAA